MTKKERYEGVIEWFLEHNPKATSELDFSNEYELLVAVMLSAQCTDKRVNMVTPALFDAYPSSKILAEATEDEVFDYISSVTYPNSKAKHLVGMAKALEENFGGKVPSNLEDLMSLPGVGRKTANVVASVAFDQPRMAVDTHVFRVSKRIGLTTNAKTPLQTEEQLVKNIPTEYIARAHHWLILHGRYVCIARKPKCEECGISSWCAYFAKEQKIKKAN